jgi:hypothetical protein
MNKINTIMPFLSLLAILFSACEIDKESRINTNVPEIIEFRALPFDM